ncbi:Spt20 family-domain-containing protein [Cunninghamella echinulata]|nr:Spt20 family-domain-containing protein [Cunninghamella echinulata]
MAAAKIMAKLQSEQNNIIQVADLHSKQGSSITKYKKKEINRNQIPASINKQETFISLKHDDQSLIERHTNDPPSLILHLYPTYFKFEHEDGFFSYKSQFKDFLTCVKEKQLPSDLMDVFNEASCQYYEGCLIVEIHDHRQINNENINSDNDDTITQIKRVVMRPTAESIWTDIQLLNEEWGYQWTEQMALEVEAQILLATEEPLCLDPSFNVSRISNAIEFSIGSKKTKKKQKWNSLEREQKLAKKVENNKLMTIMDKRAKRSFPFEPSFGNISFVQDWRTKKQKSSHDPIPSIEMKKTKNRKTLTEPPMSPNGKKCVRTIRFERPEGENRKVYTVVNLYSQNGIYDGVFRWGTVSDTSLNGGNIEFNIGPEYLMETYVVHLKTIYGQFNTLICDNNLANPVPQSPSVAARIAAAAAQQQQMNLLQNANAQQLQAQRGVQQAKLLASQQRTILTQAQQTQAQQVQSRTSSAVQSPISHTAVPTPVQTATTLPQSTPMTPMIKQPSTQGPLTVPQSPVSAQSTTTPTPQTPRQPPIQASPAPSVASVPTTTNANTNIGLNSSPALSSIQQAAIASVLAMVGNQQLTHQAALQRIQQLASSGVIPFATAQELFTQLTNPNTSGLIQQRILQQQQQALLFQQQQQALLNSQAQAQSQANAQQAQQVQVNSQQSQPQPQPQPQVQVQVNSQQQNNIRTPQQTASQLPNGLPNNNAQQPQQQQWSQQPQQQVPNNNAPAATSTLNQQLFAQLSPQHQRQIATVFMQRQHIFNQAKQGAITQEQAQMQIQQLHQANQAILQQYQQLMQQAQQHAQQQAQQQQQQTVPNQQAQQQIQQQAQQQQPQQQIQQGLQQQQQQQQQVPQMVQQPQQQQQQQVINNNTQQSPQIQRTMSQLSSQQGSPGLQVNNNPVNNNIAMATQGMNPSQAQAFQLLMQQQRQAAAMRGRGRGTVQTQMTPQQIAFMQQMRNNPAALAMFRQNGGNIQQNPNLLQARVAAAMAAQQGQTPVLSMQQQLHLNIFQQQQILQQQQQQQQNGNLTPQQQQNFQLQLTILQQQQQQIQLQMQQQQQQQQLSLNNNNNNAPTGNN